MNMNDQKVLETNQIHITDSLNASLLKLKVSLNSTSVVPNTDDLIIYVDTAPSGLATSDRKQYVFNLSSPLQYANNVSDEFDIDIAFDNNDSFIKTVVKRQVGTPNEEEVDYSSITLFEGENYIYTNYENADIEIIYPKNNEYNKIFLNSSIYNDRKINNPTDFCLDDIYFKDAFTKTGDNLNLEVDNANIECLTSKNNKFSLDAQGNLVVKTINVEEIIGSNLNLIEIFNRIYPVGSIYFSANNVSPATLFGGTWEQIQGRFILACGNNGDGTNYSSGVTGGEATHTLTTSEMPAHNHPVKLSADWEYNVGNGSGGGYMNMSPNGYGWNAGFQLITKNTGGNQAHNNMPPYYTAYVWKRTA